MTAHHPNKAQGATARERPNDLFGTEAYDEMLEGSCAAYVSNGENCSLTCPEHCVGEDELLRWARHYDARVRAARDLARDLARTHALLTLWRQASLLGDWNPQTTDLTDLLSR